MGFFEKIKTKLLNQKDLPKKNTDKSLVLIRGINGVSIDDDPMTKLERMRYLNSTARSARNVMLMDEREAIYDGTHDVDVDRNSTNRNVIGKQSNQPYRLAYELIEAQVSNNVPIPVVDAKIQTFETQGKVIEHSLKNDILNTRINKITDKNERTTMKHGFSLVEIIWNSEYQNPRYKGELEIRQVHPKCFVPQIGVWDLQDMDYFFVERSVTKQYIYQRYGVDVTGESEEHPEINVVNLEKGQINSVYEKVTEKTCWYKDSEGDIGKFTWVRLTPLEDLPKYYYRRPIKCTDCGMTATDENETTCDCGGTYKNTVEEYEIIPEDIQLNRTETTIDPMTGQPTQTPIIIPAGSKVKYYVPKEFPIVDRINVPSDFGFGGVSDIDAIRDKYMAMSKLMNNVCDIAQNPVLITKLKDMKIEFTDLIYQIVNCRDIADVQAIQVLDLKGDIISRLELIKTIYRQAKDTLGVTDSFQGKADTTAKSGLAKQMQIQQSTGRLMSKQANKDDFFKRLFERMFQFKLAYYDEARDYVVKDYMGTNNYYTFNKYDFLVKNTKNGEWEYFDDFQFSVDNGGGWERDRAFQYQQTMQLWQIGAFNPNPQAVMLWNILDKLNYPNAGTVRQGIQEQIQQQEQQMMQQQMQQQEMANAQAAQTANVPQSKVPNPDQMLNEILGSLSPEEIQHLQENPQILEEMIGG